MRNKYLIPVVALSALTACGGSGGGGSSEDITENIIDKNEPTPFTDVLTGRFVDSPVQGLRYETASQSGLTNSLGEFTYREGESVTFHIGGTQLGIAPGSDTITPFSLFGISALATEAEITLALTGDTVNSFDRAINTATLLQTLDIDGDPNNGINIGNSHSGLMSLSIPLSVKAREFEHHNTVQHAKNLAGISHSTTLSSAIQHIYESLNIHIESSLTANQTSSQNGKEVESVAYIYDNAGNLTSKNADLDNDGTIDSTKSYNYDNEGNLTLVSNSSNSTVETLNYDDENNLLSHFIEKQSGNDVEELYEYTNNRLNRFKIDLNGDGSIESNTQYSYNSQGSLSGHEIDRDNDGTIDASTRYTYSDNKLTSYSEDTNNNGSADIVISYTYDQEGNRRSQNIDSSTDGTADSNSTFEYDDRNNTIRYEQDLDLDGTADYIEAYAYDLHNNRTHYKRDLDGNGTWDVVTHYFYDINGNRTKMLEDSDGNGIADKVWTSNYQAATLDNTWDIILEKL